MVEPTSDVTTAAHEAGFLSMLVLFTLSASLPILFLLGFSGMGYGLEVATISVEYHDEATLAIQASLGLMAVMFVLDVHFWPTPLHILAWSFIFAAFSVSMCLLFTEAPYGPIVIFTILMPLFLFGIRRIFYGGVPANVYAGRISAVLLGMASMMLAAFFYWNTEDGNMWNSATNALYSNAVGCEADFTGNLGKCEHAEFGAGVPCFFDDGTATSVTFSEACPARCLDVYRACTEAFIVWANPGLAAVALFVIGMVARYLRRPDDPHAHHQISAVAKFSVVFLFLFWIFASLAGAGEGLSSSLIAFAVSMVIGSAIVVSAVFWTALTTRGDLVGGAAKQAEGYLDVLRGLVILGFSPLLVAYLLVSVVNQFVRRHLTRRCCGRKRMSDDEYEHVGCFTVAATSQIENFKSWDHAKVLSIAVYWGVGYVFLNVLASKFTTVFLSWLIEVTSDMNILAVTGIVVAVGMGLFMLPPIPGLPIYLTAGIVLVSIGREALGLWGAIAYACVVSLLLKLLACAVQQKLIGAQLGGQVSVKQMVSLNSEGIRAMRVVLSDKGITARKVAVLVGGPDWPVGVLCGILGLDVLPILVGTLPVVAVIVPTVLTGSFAYMGSIEDESGNDLYPWADTMGAVASAITAGFIFYFTLSAAAAVKDTLANDKDAIDEIPIDKQVAEADAEAEKKRIVYRRVTAWSEVPIAMKLLLIIAVLMMMGCCYLLVVFNSQCFHEYDLMYTIGEHLGGSWTNIVLPLGRVSLILFAISYTLLYIFESWATAKTKAEMEAMDDAELISLTSTKVGTYV